jgi:(p)ppGpp synthase/HD superfamily hydrolase
MPAKGVPPSPSYGATRIRPAQTSATVPPRPYHEAHLRRSTSENTSNSHRLGLRFETALIYAFRLHASQTRKGGQTPYIGHLLGVASTVIEMGGDEDQAIAALLHDAIEDQGGEPTAAAIQSMFGDRVVDIVRQCSDEDPESNKRTRANWRARKQRYLQHLQEAPRDVLLVSLADKLYNARSILLDLRQVGDELWKRFNVGKDDELWYYRSLVTAFRATLQEDTLVVMVDELERVVQEIERIADDVIDLDALPANKNWLRITAAAQQFES